MTIEEKDALQIFHGIETLPEDQRPQAAAILADYQSQQEKAGLPLWPSLARQRAAQRQWIGTVFENPRALDDDNRLFGQIQNEELAWDARHREASALLLADAYGRPVEEVRAGFSSYARDYGAKMWKENKTWAPAEFFARAKPEVLAEKQRAEDWEKTATAGYKAALRGEGFMKSLNTWQQENLATQPDLMGVFTTAYWKTASVYDKHQEVAADLFRRMEIKENRVKPGESARHDDEAIGELNPYDTQVYKLEALTPQEREQVYTIVRARAESAGWEPKHVLSQAVDYALKQNDRMTSTTNTSLYKVLRMGLQAFSPLEPMEADVKAMNDEIARRDRLAEITQEVLDLAAGHIDPVVPNIGWLDDDIEAGIIRAPGAVLPGLVTTAALGPWGGTAFFTLDFAEQNRRDLRKMGMPNDQATLVGWTAAPLQAGVESLSNLFQVGRFAKLQKALAPFNKPIGAGLALAGRYGWNSFLSLGTEYTEEQLQNNFIVPAVQEVLGVLGAHVQEVDWSFYKERALKQSPELLYTLAPAALVFGGVMTSAQVQLSQQATSNRDWLTAMGYGETQATEVLAQPDEAARIRKARELWGAREGDPLSMEAAQIKVATENRKAGLEAARELAEAVRQAEQTMMIPRVAVDAKGWVVQDIDSGTEVRVSNKAEAVALAYQGMSDLERQSAEAMAQGAEEFMGRRADERFEISKRGQSRTDEVNEGRVTAAQAEERARLYGQMMGLSAEEALATVQTVLGSNRLEQREGVRTAVSRLHGGANLLTVFHEGSHGRWKRGLETGQFTHDMGLAWVRIAEQVSGARFLPTKADAEVTPEMLDEAMADMTSAAIVARRKDGTRFTPGLISRGVASFALSGRAKAKEAGRLATFLKSWKELWGRVLFNARKLKKARAEGRLGADFDGFMDSMLDEGGYESQSLEDGGDRVSKTSFEDGNEFAGREGETSFSLAFKPGPAVSAGFNQKVDKWAKGESLGRELVSLGRTPPVLRVAGADGHGLFMPPTLLDKVTKERHGVPEQAVRGLMDSLYDPVAVFQSRGYANSMVVLTEYVEPGEGPILVAITLDKKAGNNWTVNQIASVYGKPSKTIADMFGEDVLYENKQKSLVWSRRVGQLLPKRPTPQRGEGSIPGPEDVVKWVEARAAKSRETISPPENGGETSYSLASRKAAEKKLGDDLAHKPLTTADGLTAILSKSTANKMANESAARQSLNEQAHLAAMADFENLYKKGTIVESHDDRDNDPNIRKIHRVHSTMTFGGRSFTVKFTVKELAHPPENHIYSIEVTPPGIEVTEQLKEFQEAVGTRQMLPTPEAQAVEESFFNQVAVDVNGAIRRYISEHGNRVDADLAREMCPEYAQSRESRTMFGASTGRTANGLAKLVYNSLLKTKPPGTVLFNAGGAGSGKSSTLTSKRSDEYAIIYDSVMANAKRGSELIDQALAAGHEVTLHYVHQPMLKAVELSIDRALRNGRTVPAAVVAATHLRSQKAIYEMAARYAGDPRVEVRVTDNTNFAPRTITLKELKSEQYSESQKELEQQAMDHARRYLETKSGTGEVTDAVKAKILAAPDTEP